MFYVFRYYIKMKHTAHIEEDGPDIYKVVMYMHYESLYICILHVDPFICFQIPQSINKTTNLKI